jgi:hypothetical protein
MWNCHPLVWGAAVSDEEPPLDQRTYRNIRALVFVLTILGFTCVLICVGIILSM